MKFENQTFKGIQVTLDYNEFVSCTLVECAVICYGGEYSLVHTTLSRCKFGIGGMAKQTLQFLNLVRAENPKLLDEMLNKGAQVTKDSVTFN